MTVARSPRARWVPWGEIGLSFHITANRFLHHMVRYLVGTMVEIARGWRDVDELLQLLTDPGTDLRPRRRRRRAYSGSSVHLSRRSLTAGEAVGFLTNRVHYPELDSELD